ncbi:UDP-glucose 4-epimerase [Phycomyces nitens]|nr:UDP-glucose 4-epimerase [Phycomyces nitens]
MPRIYHKQTNSGSEVVEQLKVMDYLSHRHQDRRLVQTKTNHRQQTEPNDHIHHTSRPRRHTAHEHTDHGPSCTIPSCKRLLNEMEVIMRQKYVLVTGGAGYIGSHTVLELLQTGYKIVVMDNLSNSNLEALRRVESLAGRPVHFFKGDITSTVDLERVFGQYAFWAVVHFAAIKAVGESAQIPLDYYHNNVTGSLNLMRVMNQFKVKNLVFSSSATVYGEPEIVPVNESARLGPVTNPYGRTKLFVEEMIRDLCKSDPEWNVCLLRFFNPVGAHESGMIGEHPQGIPNNLLPYVIQVLQGRLPHVCIYGDDYDTPDGTGVRDYIHVSDLATGHVAALRKLEKRPGCVAYNLGTGTGYSVKEIVNAMEKATKKKIPFKVIS